MSTESGKISLLIIKLADLIPDKDRIVSIDNKYVNFNVNKEEKESK